LPIANRKRKLFIGRKYATDRGLHFTFGTKRTMASNGRKQARVPRGHNAGMPRSFIRKDYYTLPLEVAYPFTRDGIRHQFTTGELKLVRGIIPEAESQIAQAMMPYCLGAKRGRAEWRRLCVLRSFPFARFIRTDKGEDRQQDKRQCDSFHGPSCPTIYPTLAGPPTFAALQDGHNRPIL
jgi:hypothetical protein